MAESLVSYAALLRKVGRADEATAMDARANVIRAKHAPRPNELGTMKSPNGAILMSHIG